MKNRMIRRSGLSALFLSGALTGAALTGAAVAAQGHMDAALRALQTAKFQLQAAVPDKGGHRERALSDVNAAMAEVQAGINFARMH